jgi:hypothetical protein
MTIDLSQQGTRQASNLFLVERTLANFSTSEKTFLKRRAFSADV